MIIKLLSNKLSLLIGGFLDLPITEHKKSQRSAGFLDNRVR